MARFYYTADGVSFEGPNGVDKAAYLEGRSYTLPAGSPGNGLRVEPVSGPIETSGLYLAQEDNQVADPPEYYLQPLNLTVSGALLTPGTVVVEDRTPVQIPIADLYNLKRAEIAAQDQEVRYNAVDTSLAANWWIVVTQAMRFEILGVQGNWLQRQQDGQGWPGGVNQPWIGIYNANNGRARREQVTSDTAWETAFLEITMHDQACGNATDASLAALDVAYADGAGNWQDVADHDAADPAWGYPPTVDLSDSAVILFGR